MFSSRPSLHRFLELKLRVTRDCDLGASQQQLAVMRKLTVGCEDSTLPLVLKVQCAFGERDAFDGFQQVGSVGFVGGEFEC